MSSLLAQQNTCHTGEMTAAADAALARALLTGANTFRAYDLDQWWVMRPVADVAADLGVAPASVPELLLVFDNGEETRIASDIWEGVHCTYAPLRDSRIDAFCRLLNDGHLPPVGLPAHLAS